MRSNRQHWGWTARVPPWFGVAVLPQSTKNLVDKVVSVAFSQQWRKCHRVKKTWLTLGLLWRFHNSGTFATKTWLTKWISVVTGWTEPPVVSGWGMVAGREWFKTETGHEWLGYGHRSRPVIFFKHRSRPIM